MAEFAVVVTALVALAAIAVNAVALAVAQLRIQSVAATAVRVAARGGALSEPLRRELEAAGAVVFTINGDLITVAIEHPAKFLSAPVTLRVRATARTEVSSDEFGSG